ncbi:restriction endonuclease subunit S [Vibrio parahaemolyticus]|nr:restriction endonuclease subunit S [Vibrio parahaemolyticus]ELA9422620.1 restriction endonuclease subunit S [Vibrio parahaemolyticus]MBM4966467.1 restriction endonuclease subunit S [Vibrio parahaemolyticus]
MLVTLKEIAVIRSGHPFRGSIEEALEGNGYVIQTRDQSVDGKISWSKLVRADVAGRKEPEWLQAGDVIFAARGIRNLASWVSEGDLSVLDLPVICSPHYFQIRLNSTITLLPEFLAWQLNQSVAQRHFQQSAEGTMQVSIRRSVLEETPITIPPLETQRKVVSLSQRAHREEQIYQELIQLRRMEMQAIANQVLNEQSKNKR